MPLYILELSTDADIVNTGLAAGWPALTARYAWEDVKGMNLAIPGASDLIVIAHGDSNEIGNADPGEIDITANGLLSLIYENTAGAPAQIFISACAKDIALFAQDLRQAVAENNLWQGVRIYGHWSSVFGDVPAPNDIRWDEIF